MRRSGFAAAATLVAVALAGCASGAESEPPGAEGPAVSGPSDAHGDAVGDPAVPEECATPFPFAVGAPDDSDLALRPADWPAPPAGAVLCGTSATVTGQQESVDYALDSPADDVLDHYESALSGVDVVERVDDGLGPILSGVVGAVAFAVDPVDGGFRLIFQENE